MLLLEKIVKWDFFLLEKCWIGDYREVEAFFARIRNTNIKQV